MSVTRDFFRTAGGTPLVAPPAQIDPAAVGRAVTFLTLTGADTVSAPAISADPRR
jgi:hypothetical protein